MRQAPVVCAVLVLALIAGASTAGARSATKIKVGAHFAYLELGLINPETKQKDGACHWTVGIEFSAVPGAKSYLVEYWDAYFGKLSRVTLKPAQFQDRLLPKGMLPAGKHFLDVTGGAYSPPCGREDFTGEKSRFHRGAQAWALK